MKEIIKNKIVVLVLTIICMVVIAIIAGFVIYGAGKEQTVTSYMELTQKYAEDLEYERAVVEYTEILEIEPNKELMAILERRKEIEDSIGTGYKTGQLLPEFTFYSADGAALSMEDFWGKPIYINFFTTWCPYCYLELPDMQTMCEKYPDVEFIMIDLAEDTELVAQYAADFGITIPIYHLPYWDVGEYTIEGVPTSFVIDKYGAVTGIHKGMVDAKWMDANLEEALSH